MNWQYFVGFKKEVYYIFILNYGTVPFRLQTYGLCGTLNGDIKDEMSSLSGSQTDDSSFLKVYGDCTLPVKKPITESAEQVIFISVYIHEYNM